MNDEQEKMEPEMIRRILAKSATQALHDIAQELSDLDATMTRIEVHVMEISSSILEKQA